MSDARHQNGTDRSHADTPGRKYGGTVVVGGGLAGLFTALKLAPLPVTVLAAAPLGDGASSAWAQGGIAAAIGARIPDAFPQSRPPLSHRRQPAMPCGPAKTSERSVAFAPVSPGGCHA